MHIKYTTLCFSIIIRAIGLLKTFEFTSPSRECLQADLRSVFEALIYGRLRSFDRNERELQAEGAASYSGIADYGFDVLSNTFSDEVGAVVFDYGHYSFRAGYAGEDAPKADIPSAIGLVDQLIEGKDELEKKYLIDVGALNYPRKGVELQSFLKDGLIDDWELFEKILDYSYDKHIRYAQHESQSVRLRKNPKSLVPYS